MSATKFEVQREITPKPIRPSIVDGELVKVSVSQIETFRACNRKWYFDKVAKEPRPPVTEALRKGTAGHEEYEKFLLTGATEHIELARAGVVLLDNWLKYAPFNGGRGQIECPLPDSLKFDNVAVEGYIDFFIPDTAHVFDWKFKSQLKNAYGTEKLLQDFQANLYALAAMTYLDCDEVTFSHVTHQTKGHAAAKHTSAVFTRQSVLPKWEQMKSITLDEIAPVAKAVTQDEVAYNTSSCSLYNTECPYASVCNKSPRNRHQKEGNMKVQEAVQGKHYEFPDGKRGKYLRELKGLYKFQQEDGKLFSKDAADDMVELSAIESLKNESEVSARDALAAEELSLIRPGAVAEVFNPPKQEPPKQEPPKEELKVEKKKWGKKEKKVDTDSPVQASLDDGFVLIIDRPIVGAGTDLAPYVAGLCQKLCEKFNLPDVRLATGDNLLAFGRWKAMLGGLAAENPPKGLCFLMRSELNDPVIEALLPLAKGFVV